MAELPPTVALEAEKMMQKIKVRLQCDALHDLVPFVQFKKREKYPWKGVTFSKV